MTQKFSRFLSEATIIIVAFLLTVTIRLLQWTPIDFARVLSLMPKRVKECWLRSNVENVEEKAYEYDYEQDCLGHITYVEQHELDEYLDNPGDYAMADIMNTMTIEERIYRFRCVEAWSMVVPWNGFELADLLDMAGVQEGAKYVAFETALRPDEMPGVRFPVLDWPYVEGLRLDEAMHPLTIMATGIYDKPIPNQNGAPMRLVVPWKYGYKSIKSIVRITLTDQQPPTSWNKSQSSEYGFYSNVNPTVDHPRWSQATERRIGGGLFSRRQDTLMFNGYEEEVASLYQGMDLSANF